MKLSYILIIVPLFCACNNKFTPNDTPVAKVYDKYLLRSEITSLIPAGTSNDDSIMMAKNYVKNWVTKALLLHKANQNLSDKEKDIRQQVEDYSTSILIYKYKEKLVSQKLESAITEAEIDQYYNENKFNFLLNTPIVRALLIIIPKSAPNIDNVRKWFHSPKAKDQAALEEYCISSAKKYDNFNDQWVELRHLLNILPITASAWENKFKDKEYIETEDNENYYFLKINETKQEHEIAPLDYVKKEIGILLLNKRKIVFEENLEKQINEEGLRKDHVKIY